MSDDFDFNRDDLFDDFDNDDDFGGDDFDSDNFDFGDEGDDFSLDDDAFGADLDAAIGDDDFGGGDDDDDFATTESAGGGGTSPVFIIAVIAMLVVFLFGIGIILYILFFQGPSPEVVAIEQTRSAIETENAVRMTQIVISETAAVDNATATEGAIQTATAQYTPPTETPTPTLTPTEDFTATADFETQQAVSIQQTAEQQALFDIDATATAFELTLNPREISPTPEVLATEDTAPVGETSVPLGAVQQTATALALLFGATPTSEQIQPTSIIEGTPVVSGSGSGGTTTSGQGGGTSGALPDTGLFDEVFQGNPFFIFLAAFGLLGVIVVSRSVRGSQGKRED